MADSDITARIHEILTDYVRAGDVTSRPYFSAVFKGPSEGLTPANKLAQWEYLGSRTPAEGAKTLGNTMRLDIFRVKVFWTRTALNEARESFEDDAYVVS